MNKLSGRDIATLAHLLADTLPFDDLESFVHASTGEQLYNAFVAQDQPKIPMIRKLLSALEELGTTDLFLSYVYINRLGRKDVRDAIKAFVPNVCSLPKKIDVSAQTGGLLQLDQPESALAPGLQRNVRPHLAKLDIRIWQDKLLSVQRQVCRIEVEGNALGTGFLVGPDAVLTNWHVLEVAKKAGKVARLGCRFDYVRLPSGIVDVGQLVMLDQASDIDASPCSKAEETASPDEPPPTSDELDYALLRAERRVGDDVIDGKPRGWISLPAVALPLPANAPILIVQHPEGSPMKLALDTEAVIGLNQGNTRLRYRTNTEAGSSGSPVFSMDWDIVALHHYGDPRWRRPNFNQGVPIDMIRRQIVKHGFATALAIEDDE